MSKRWYVVQSKLGQEKLAAQELRKQRFDIFFPTFIRKSRCKRTGKPSDSISPLFPSYLFVEFDVKRNKRWQKINNTRGVKTLLACTEKTVSPVPKGCVEAILAKRDRKGHVSLEDCMGSIIKFLPEQQLKIIGGAYDNVIATYCNHSEKRVIVLLSLLNRKLQVSLPLESVQPVS